MSPCLFAPARAAAHIFDTLALNGLLHFIPDARKPSEIVNRLMDALPSGSALSVSHVTPDFDPESWEKIVRIYNDSGTAGRARHKDEVAQFFDGLDLIAPGIEVAHRWHPEVENAAEPEGGKAPTDAEVSVWAGVGIKR